MNEEFKFIVNIPRPYPETGENEKIITYIEPAREAGEVLVSSAYSFNLDQFKAGKECSCSPGFKYMFWFKDKDKADEFGKLFGAEA